MWVMHQTCSIRVAGHAHTIFSMRLERHINEHIVIAEEVRHSGAKKKMGTLLQWYRAPYVWSSQQAKCVCGACAALAS